MKRIREENINTPELFNKIWNLENVHRYDAVRLRAFLEHMDETKLLLDVGAGWMGVAQYAIHHGYPGRYIAADFSTEARRRTLELTPTLDYRICSATELPFADGSIDVVACGELIEHFHAPEILVAELARVCKPGGYIVISTLDANCEAAIAHGDYPEHVVQWDSPEELLPLFEPYGQSRAWVLGHYFCVECRKRT